MQIKTATQKDGRAARTFLAALGRSLPFRTGVRSQRLRVPAYAPRIAEFGAVILLGAALAKIAAAWLLPLPVSSAPGATAAAGARSAPEPIVNPFRAPIAGTPNLAAASTGVVEAADTDLNLTLYGTWTDSRDASATIGQGEEPQKVYRIGDEVCCGARLEQVFTTHVLINRGGAVEALRLANKLADQTAAPPAATQAATGGGAALADLSALVSLQPTLSPGGAVEFAIAPAGDPEIFASLGLLENDVIVSVNGVAAPPTADKIPEFFNTLRGANAFKVVVRRAGALVTVDFGLPLAVRGQEG